MGTENLSEQLGWIGWQRARELCLKIKGWEEMGGIASYKKKQAWVMVRKMEYI